MIKILIEAGLHQEADVLQALHQIEDHGFIDDRYSRTEILLVPFDHPGALDDLTDVLEKFHLPYRLV